MDRSVIRGLFPTKGSPHNLCDNAVLFVRWNNDLQAHVFFSKQQGLKILKTYGGSKDDEKLLGKCRLKPESKEPVVIVRGRAADVLCRAVNLPLLPGLHLINHAVNCVEVTNVGSREVHPPDCILSIMDAAEAHTYILYSQRQGDETLHTHRENLTGPEYRRLTVYLSRSRLPIQTSVPKIHIQGFAAFELAFSLETMGSPNHAS